MGIIFKFAIPVGSGKISRLKIDIKKWFKADNMTGIWKTETVLEGHILNPEHMSISQNKALPEMNSM